MEVQESKETIYFVDWDDTLLPTTFLATKGFTHAYGVVSKELALELKKIDETCVEFLSLLIQHGRVCIITNAKQGWVGDSSRKFMPNTSRLLHKGIDVVSARSRYEFIYNSPAKWKYHAMLDEYKRIPLKTYVTIVSFGDSFDEREAAIDVSKSSPNAICKSIKFSESPTCTQLIAQLKMVMSAFSYINDSTTPLDLQLTIEANPIKVVSDLEITVPTSGMF